MMTILMKGGNEGIGIPEVPKQVRDDRGYAEKIH